MAEKTSVQQLLPFISNESLYRHVKTVLDCAKKATIKADEKLYKNKIDPFSALFDALSQGISLERWLKQEKSRQIQKTLQNAVGVFHQEIIGSMSGWESLGTGNVFDVKSDTKKIVAEIKNKYNTTKGNHKVAIYDDLKKQIEGKYIGYVAYYVEVIPKAKEPYDKPFTPSDNTTHTKRPENEKIRIIEGKSFYELASGDPAAIKKLYQVLPAVIQEILSKNEYANSFSAESRKTDIKNDVARDLPKNDLRNSYQVKKEDEFKELFSRVY